MNEHAKHIIDWAAVGTTIGAVMAWIPQATALIAFVWWCIRIYETKTVQKWLNNRKNTGDC